MVDAPDHSPMVTVVVPNYNHARYLSERLESIFRQTYQDFELIVLDDASTDDSLEVLRKYADQRGMQLVTNPKNSGSPFAQWARGAALARGEFLWLAESDDSADAKLLERLVAVLSAQPQVGLAYCQSRRMDPEGKIGDSCEEWNRSLDASRWKTDYVNDGRDEISRYLAIHNTIPNASAVLVRTAVFRRAVEGANAFRLSGDWRTWINMLMASDVAFVADCLNYFRIHPRSVRDTTHHDQGCAERLAVKAYACKTARVGVSVRRSSFVDEYPNWVRCLNAESITARLPWLVRTFRIVLQIWSPGIWWMFGSLLSTLLKRTFLHRLSMVSPTNR